MNKDLIIKERKLKEEELFLCYTTKKINYVLKYQSFYQKPESLEALKKIKEYLQEKEQRLESIQEERKQIKQEIKRTCHHEIIIKTHFNTSCCICKRVFINPPEFKHILVEYNDSITPSLYDTIDQTIIEMLENKTDTNNILNNFEDKITTKIKSIKLYRRTQ